MLAAQSQQRLNASKRGLLVRCAALDSKCVSRILRPPSGKIVTVLRIRATWHSNFVAVVELRNSAQRQRETKREPQFCVRASLEASQPRHVMVPEERHQLVRPYV